MDIIITNTEKPLKLASWLRRNKPDCLTLTEAVRLAQNLPIHCYASESELIELSEHSVFSSELYDLSSEARPCDGAISIKEKAREWYNSLTSEQKEYVHLLQPGVVTA